MYRIVEAQFSISPVNEGAAAQRLTDSFEIHADTIHEAFEELGFELVRSDGGKIAALRAESEGHPHDDIDNVFRVVAPFVEDGSTVVFEDGDGDRWQYTFRSRRCTRQNLTD